MNDLLHSFPGQEQNEPVYVFARPYPVSFIPTALVFFIIFAFSLLGQAGLVTGVFSELSVENTNAGIIFLGIFQLFTLVVFLTTILDFYFDIVIVTDRRVVDIDQEMLFFRRISQLGLESVEDTSGQIAGFLGTLFNYGQVQIQTAGTRENFMMQNVHYPNEVTAIVLDLADQAAKGIPAEQRIPQSKVLAVISSKTLFTIEELQEAGAILPDDLRRVHRP